MTGTTAGKCPPFFLLAGTGFLREARIIKLADVIAPTAIRVASEVSSKKRALEEVANMLAAGVPNLDPRVVFSALIAREKLGSTGLGSGVGIPHGRIPDLQTAVCAILRLPGLIDFEAMDRQGVDLLFALIVPEDATSAHLELLAQIARMCQDEDAVKALRTAEDAESLYAFINHYDADE